MSLSNRIKILAKIFGILLFITITINNDPMNNIAQARSSSNNAITIEVIDLGLSDVITQSETTYNRTIFLEKEWNEIVLNMTIQNFGDPLDGVFLQVNMENYSSQRTFSKLEQVGFVKAISYQFELQQNLVLPVDYSDDGFVKIQILVILDHTASVQIPIISFSINQTEILVFDNPQPDENVLLPLFGGNQQYLIQPSSIFFLEKKIVVHTYLFSKIPFDMQLDATVTLSLDGVGFDKVQINGESFASKGNNYLIFNLSLTESSSHFCSLDFIIYPSYNQLSDLTEVSLFISISGKLNELSGSNSKNKLDPNPIPWWLMYPIILIGLFAFPYYYVYKEHLMARDEEFLDPKRSIKIK